MIHLTRPEFDVVLQQPQALPGRHREHFEKVLRRREDWTAIVSDGEGRLSQARVASGKIILNGETTSMPPLQAVHLIQSWVKPKALALILQKCAELGATSITLVDSEHSEMATEKTARFELIIETACMQAHNCFRPRMSLGKKLTELEIANTNCYFGNPSASGRISIGQGGTFINGPEGGFSNAESEWLTERATGVQISENVLRAETAAIFAVGILRLYDSQR